MEKEHHEGRCHIDFTFLGAMTFAGFETNVSGVCACILLFACLFASAEGSFRWQKQQTERKLEARLGEGGFHYS